MDRLKHLITSDSLRMQALRCVRTLNLPQCYIAAGFIRNLVWDDLHGYNPRTLLNDVDVIYFDPKERSTNQNTVYENALTEMCPSIVWQVRNQAKLHTRNQDRAYTSVVDAMSFWPEKETAIAVRLLANGSLDVISSFGIKRLFDLTISYNNKRKFSEFAQRVDGKNWLVHWPKLKLHQIENNDNNGLK
ncbi:nucleotidyltransferase family protein [Vibrio sinus]|uniref:nucleotidyltransferase family protein n=1 Tax=Vibrio sinus TaxID=2946865 RepID=UPI0032B464A0